MGSWKIRLLLNVNIPTTVEIKAIAYENERVRKHFETLRIKERFENNIKDKLRFSTAVLATSDIRRYIPRSHPFLFFSIVLFCRTTF